MFTDHNTYITPYLPQEAEEDIRNWRAKDKPAMQRVLPESSHAQCRNCQDSQFVLVSFCKAGPFNQVPGISRGETLTYNDQGPGIGWYIVKQTLSYECPHCAGKPYELGVKGPASSPPEWWTEV